MSRRKPQQRKKRGSTRGIGRCGAPNCPNDKAPGHFLCENCLPPVIQVKDRMKMEAKDRAVFSPRDRGFQNTKRTPTCCWFGCSEPRSSGYNYCEYHSELEEEVG